MRFLHEHFTLIQLICNSVYLAVGTYLVWDNIVVFARKVRIIWRRERVTPRLVMEGILQSALILIGIGGWLGFVIVALIFKVLELLGLKNGER